MLDFFFFSSRRRHTRWPRDWSSDVCSSDLCRKEAPDLQEISQDYGEQGVSFIGINVRDEAEIGRASCRERGWRSDGGVTVKRRSERNETIRGRDNRQRTEDIQSYWTLQHER